MTDAEIAGYMDWRGPGAYTKHQMKRIHRIIEEVQRRERESWPSEMEAMERQVNILTDALAAEQERCLARADIALLGADIGLRNRVHQAIRARGNT